MTMHSSDGRVFISTCSRSDCAYEMVYGHIVIHMDSCWTILAQDDTEETTQKDRENHG